MNFELSIINGKTVFDIIRAHRNECIGIVRDAYLAHDHGQSVNPDSYFLKFPDSPIAGSSRSRLTSERTSTWPG